VAFLLDKEFRLTLRATKRLRLARGRATTRLLSVSRVLSKWLSLRPIYFEHVARLVRKTGLFDEAYYLDVNEDVVGAAITPLRHYVRYGDREGRQPIPFFDPTFYREHVKTCPKRTNALLHYHYVGRFLGVSPSPWFDLGYYLGQNKDVDRRGMDPLFHYLRYGWEEGRSPSPQFDGNYYLRLNPDVREAQINPLVHYLWHGRHEGRATLPGQSGRQAESFPSTDVPEDISQKAWDQLNRPLRDGAATVDVIVPVYKHRKSALRCLYRLLESENTIPFEITVINDFSPDGQLVADLKCYAERGLFRLMHNDENRGFVFTANRGMALHPDRDVVLLNSDTEVYGDWLDRLSSAAYRHPRTATATPLSNNATICSYPRFLRDNPYPLEIQYEALDGMAARCNAGIDFEAPTGVGFCMYLRRDCLTEIGPFDEQTFGKGYGEENDYCQRAVRRGWRNVIAGDVFVRHLGRASFQGETSKRVARALKELRRLHPRYDKEVQAFIRRDPLAEARERLDWARLESKVRQENVLFVCHDRGGGAERHVAEDTRLMRDQGKNVFYLRPESGKSTHVRLGHPDCARLPNLASFDLQDTRGLADVLGKLRITSIHSHGLVDFVADAPKLLLEVAKSLGVPLHVDIHDYKVICPRMNLADQRGLYCGEPSTQECDKCLVENGNDFDVRDITKWRETHHQVLKEVEEVWVPDPDVSARLSRYYPDIGFAVAPHDGSDATAAVSHDPVLDPIERLRILVPGAISKIKGYEVLLRCATQVQRERLPLEFVVMGYSHSDGLLEKAGVHVTGRYIDQEALDKLKTLNPHVIWLPSTWPETYSYTLSLALKSGYPIFSFDLGAIGRRMRALGRAGFLWPLSLATKPQQINSRFLSYRSGCISSSIATGSR
jgi:GT2 family glycosyltransferase/glycosyltransferase involved in cell wall biosynthesis